MISYRDRAYCASKVEKHTCGREFTAQDAADAEKWWGGKDYPVAYGNFCEHPPTPTIEEQALNILKTLFPDGYNIYDLERMEKALPKLTLLITKAEQNARLDEVTRLAKYNGAKVVTIPEIAEWVNKREAELATTQKGGQ